MAYYETPFPLQRRRKIFSGVLLAVLGAASIAASLWTQGLPPEVWIWVAFAVTNTALEFAAVEVNDRLITSSTSAVAVAAGLIFGPQHAIGGVVAMAALGILQPRDITDRRWFQPMVNLGIVTLPAALNAILLVAIMPADFTDATLGRVVVAGAVAAAAGEFLSFAMVRTVVKHVFGFRHAGPWSGLRQILLGFIGLGAMGGLLGYAYIRYAVDHGAYNVMLFLVLATLAISHQFFASLGKLRVARESMLATLVKTLEAKDLYTRGHTERVAKFAVQLAQELRLSGDAQERIRHAALLHDLGKLAVPRELLKKRGRLTNEETEAMRDHVHHIDDLLDDVEWLHPLVSIASDHHAHYDGGGYHGSHSDQGQKPAAESRVLAIADAFDAMTSNRPYRMALTQDEAFRELREGSGTQFDPEMVESFITMISRGGLTYGALVRMTDEEARKFAEERRWALQD